MKKLRDCGEPVIQQKHSRFDPHTFSGFYEKPLPAIAFWNEGRI